MANRRLKLKHHGVSKKAQPAARRAALGRGLSALMESTIKPVRVSKQEEAMSLESKPSPAAIFREKFAPAAKLETRDEFGDNREDGLLYLSLERVFPNRRQPRQHFPSSEIETLAQSVKESGVLQPIIVRRKKAESGVTQPCFEIVTGERRFRAAKLAGLAKIPAILKKLDDKEAFQLGLIENAQRQDLDPIEEALAFERLTDEFGGTQEEAAKLVGRDRVSVANSLRLLKLPKEIQALITQGKLTAGHGRAILMIESAQHQKALAEQIMAEDLSVRETERRARDGRPTSADSSKRARTLQVIKSPTILELEERIRRVLGTKVSLTLGKDGGGELRISFFSRAELEKLLEQLGA